MKYMIDVNGNYFEAEQNPRGETEVPKRPSANHVYANGSWVFDNTKLAAIKVEKLSQLEAARKAAETSPVTVQGKPFPSTEEFQAKVSRALNYIGRGKPLNLSGAWRDSNASSVTMTQTLLGQIEDAITAQGVAAWKNYWTKFDAVMNAQTIEDVDAVVW